VFKVTDWWTELGYIPAFAEIGCSVCGSTHGIARNGEKGWAVCRQHHHCTDAGIEAIFGARIMGLEIEPAQWEALRLNSYDRDAIIPHLSTSVLLGCLEMTLKNCSRFDPPASTYDEALQLYAGEMLRRLKAT